MLASLVATCKLPGMNPVDDLVREQRLWGHFLVTPSAIGRG